MVAAGVPWGALRDLTPGEAAVLADSITQDRAAR